MSVIVANARNQQPTATASRSVTVPGEGAFELHFFSTGCDNQQEALFTPQPVGTNWATFKTQPLTWPPHLSSAA